MYADIRTFGVFGLNGYEVKAEADTARGFPSFDIVGLPDASVSESKDRVRFAAKNCGLNFPTAKVTVNLAPADVRKSGPAFDLPILLAVAKASGELCCDTADCAFVGELGLNGELRPVSGAISIAQAAAAAGIRRLFVPLENAGEAAFADVEVYGAAHAADVLRHLRGEQPLARQPRPDFSAMPVSYGVDFSEVKGQYRARLAMEIAATGGHNVLLIGPAGSGKSMLAERMPTILPPLDYDEAIEITKIYSAAGELSGRSLITTRPYRAPHHTASTVGLIGGGTVPLPGEISKANCGVLFLDELPEFPRSTLDSLRQPLENGCVTLSRAYGAYTYPCSVMLVAAMNPCPCGNFGNPKKKCTCAPYQIERYLGRVSGPLLDRIDMHVEVPAVDYATLTGSAGESSADILKRVVAARARQKARYAGLGFELNAHIPPALIKRFCRLTPEAERFMQSAFERLSMSARAHSKLLKTARTIADLEGCETIEKRHIASAVQFRALDSKYWERG